MGLTWEKLNDLVERLRPREPYPERVWFVDCPATMNRLLGHSDHLVWLEAHPMFSSGVSRFQTWYGIPVVEWCRAWWHPPLALPPVPTVPGMYIEMSDGSIGWVKL